MGTTGTIYRHEAYFQVFEASLMVRPYATFCSSILIARLSLSMFSS